MAIALAIALATISLTVGLANYLHWTVHFAAQRRLPGIGLILEIYRQPSFFWTLPALGAGLFLCRLKAIKRLWVKPIAFSLMAAPFAVTLATFFLQEDAADRADVLLAVWPLTLLVAAAAAFFALRSGITISRLIPFVVLAAIHGTFLSQQLWGSTYAIWPLLLILLASIIAVLPVRARFVGTAWAAAICATFLVCGGSYAASLERLSYIRTPDEPLERSRAAALRGMVDRGSYLANFDELIDFSSREIPFDEPLLLLPGEDPFYFATGRTPRFPVLLFDPTTDPDSPGELLAEARRRNVRWVIVKRALQSQENPMPDADATLKGIDAEFGLYRRLAGYDIFRRRN